MVSIRFKDAATQALRTDGVWHTLSTEVSALIVPQTLAPPSRNRVVRLDIWLFIVFASACHALWPHPRHSKRNSILYRSSGSVVADSSLCRLFARNWIGTDPPAIRPDL